MATYDLIVDQHVRYFLTVEADSPEAATQQVESGIWDDSDNTVLRDVVRVYPEGIGQYADPAMRKGKLLYSSDPEQSQVGGLYDGEEESTDG